MKKICSTCGEEKDLDDYRNLTSSIDGHANTCRACKIKQETIQRKRRIEKNNNGTNIVEYKTCLYCKETKSVLEFHKHQGSTKDGYNENCKVCSKIKSKEKIERIKAREKIIPETKFCNKCKQTKPINDFGTLIKSIDGHNSICKECKRKHDNEHYHKTKDTNPLRKMKRNISASIREWFDGTNYKKTKPSIKYGVDVDAIFNHIGPCPVPGYQMDHIIPVAIFDYSNEHHIYLSQHPYNLRWISGDENNSKNDFIIWSLISSDTFLSTVAEYIGLNSLHDGMRARDIVL